MPWFKRSDGQRVEKILDHYEDTIARLRAEGWVEIDDPTIETTPAPAERATSAPPRDAPAPAHKKRGR